MYKMKYIKYFCTWTITKCMYRKLKILTLCVIFLPSSKISLTFFMYYHLFSIELFLKDFIYLFFREGKSRKETMCGYLSSTPYWGPGPQPRHVP